MSDPEVINNLCAISVIFLKDIDNACMCIKNEMMKRKIKYYGFSLARIPGKEIELSFLINESNIFPFMEIMGILKNDLKIKHCLIDSSMALISWKGLFFSIYEESEKYRDKIRRVFENEKGGFIICENESAHDICNLFF